MNNLNLNQDVIDAIKSGKKVNAIKLLRDSERIDLKKAKNIVDSYCLNNRISTKKNYSKIRVRYEMAK